MNIEKIELAIKTQEQYCGQISYCRHLPGQEALCGTLKSRVTGCQDFV